MGSILRGFGDLGPSLGRPGDHFGAIATHFLVNGFPLRFCCEKGARTPPDKQGSAARGRTSGALVKRVVSRKA